MREMYGWAHAKRARARVHLTAGVVVVVSVLVVSACGSDGGGGAGPLSSSADRSSVAVASGVVKDSVLDLNSTKDMTGVVTTVPIGQSPYDKNMPDICGFITQGAMDQLGMARKKKGFTGSPLVAQNCQLTPPESAKIIISAIVYVNNIREHLSVPNLSGTVTGSVHLFGPVAGQVMRDRATNFVGGPYTCDIAWGTFYGTAVIQVLDFKSDRNICERTETAARILGPLMPRKPVQMRPTS